MDLKMEGSNIDTDTDVRADVPYYNSSLKQASESEIHLLLCSL